jgi:CRP/FNR family transcriptional regulator, anaerobic regulatory protein
MFEVLHAYFIQRMPLTAAQFQLMQTLFIPRHLEKGELLLREGEVARYGAFVAKGCLRSYVVDHTGKEHIIQFAPETWWLTDTNSIMNHVPSLYFMDALEPSDILLIDMPGHKRMMDEIPGFAASFMSGTQKHTAVKDKRIISSLTATAEERYRNFLDTYPSIAQRVPQHMLASYLGLSPETLSRVRKRWSLKK